MYRVAFFLDKAQINEVSLKELIVENSDVTLHDVAYTVSHVESWTDLDGPGLHVAHAHVYPKLVKPAIFQSSPLLGAKPTFAPGAAIVGKTMYPFAELEVGQSFAIPLASAKIKSLRTLILKYSKPETGKTFAMVIHEEAQTVEVGRTK